MISDQQLRASKAVRIVDYLQSIGHEPVKTVGHELLYFSPKNDEKSPSFRVNPGANVFNDFSGPGERGDVIRLVQYLTGCTFPEAVRVLQAFAPATEPRTLFFSGQKDELTQTDKSLLITDVRPLTNRALWHYVRSRHISEPTTKTYLKEVHYEATGKKGFGLGFENDKGGFEIRNTYWKTSSSPKHQTTFEVAESQTVNLFEGFFDFLSACECFSLLRPRNTTIVLNSLVHLPNVLERLKIAKKVNVYFDNDGPGKKALETIMATGTNVLDGSSHYAPHKDFNEYWCLNRT